MQSVKSCFNPTLFRKNLARFWPIWALYGVMWALMLPVSVLNDNYHWDAETAQSLPLDALPEVGLVLAGFFGLLCAMAVFSYLYNSRSVGMLHALPLRRVDLFCTNFLAGLSFLILPNAVIFLLTLLAEVVAGSVNVGSLCMWLVVQSLMCFFFYAFAVFCAMFTGHILALPAFYSILNILASTLVFLFENLAQEFVYGFESVSRLNRTALLLTPALKLATTMNVRHLEGRGPSFYGLHIVLLYTFVGLVLTALALVVYEKRHLETAGDVVTVPWVRPIFKYGVAFCAAIAFGTFLYRVVDLPEGPWTLLILLLLCGCVGYFAAEMLLKKSFRVFRDSWKGCIAVVVCLIAAVCAMEFDLVGFERRVPDVDRVVSAQVHCSTEPYDALHDSDFTLTEPEELELLLQVHQAVIASKDAPTRYDYSTVDGVSAETQGTASLEIVYTLDDDSVFVRYYTSLPVRTADLESPGSLTALLAALTNQPEVVKRTYFKPSLMEDARLVDAEVTMLDHTEDEDAGYASEVVPTEALPELWAAIQADMSAGRLGRRYLLDSLERKENCYLSDLHLSFRVPITNRETGETHLSNLDVGVTLQASAAETLKVLEEYGVITDTVRPVSHAEDARREDAEKYGTYTESVYDEDVPFSEEVEIQNPNSW